MPRDYSGSPNEAFMKEDLGEKVMVKRWNYANREDNENGAYVLYSDYQALREALREALKMAEIAGLMPGEYPKRKAYISQLRSLYLRGEEE